MRALLALAIVTSTSVAHAWPMPPAPPEPEPEPAPAPVTEAAPPIDPDPPPPTPAELADRIEQLEYRADTSEVVEQRVDTVAETVASLVPLRRFLTAYIDVGWFTVGGNGAGVRSDVGHLHVADHDMVPADWVLLGDPLSTAINARGEPADIGAARAIDTDTINSEGHPSFIVSALGLAVGRPIGGGISLAGLVEFLPRPGPDTLAVELAQIDYRPVKTIDLVFSAGKIESVLGVEYRAQDAPTRLTVTPSLACRYTCGRPLGVQGRLNRGRLSTSLSVTSGDSFNERFEIDEQSSYHGLPTVAAHLQWMLPVGQGLEVGVSGAIGPQDGQSSSDLTQWHYGVDLRLRDLHGLDVYAEYVQGKQPGSSAGDMAPRCGIAACLTYKAAYVLAGARVRPWLTPYARVDWRDARHQHGIDFLYVTSVLRTTFGVHVEVTSRVIAKLEYTGNFELGSPQFPNDVLTSSVVVSTN